MRSAERIDGVATMVGEQYDLFGGTPPHVKKSDTSKDAAESMVPHVGRLQGVILDHVRRSPTGFTCDEIEIITGLRHQSASARVRELFLKGMIRRDGKRKTSSGRQAHVYVWVKPE